VRILLVHNEYGKPSGEEMVVTFVRRMLEKHGHEVVLFNRSSEEIETMPFGEIRAFFNGIYNQASRRQIRRLLSKEKPDLVHIHNVFPLISPSVLPECRLAGMPVVMTVHNYRLICPNGLNVVRGQVCEKCCGGQEIFCVLRNCEGDIFKSIGYAVRTYVARKRRYFLDNVSMYAALTEFQRQRLIAEGFPAERIDVVPNMVEPNGFGPADVPGQYVGYVGRVSPEKGVDTLVAAGRECSSIAFKVAGDYHRMLHLVRRAPRNFEFLGHLDSDAMKEFYASAKIIVLCSIWYEGFPMVLVEAMLHSKLVICSRIGGLPEIVEDGVTGLLFDPGNAGDLAEKIQYLWDRPDLCKEMGRAGREKALQEYSHEKYYERLMAVYDKAIELGPGGPVRHTLKRD